MLMDGPRPWAIASFAVGIAILLLMLAASIQSRREREARAARSFLVLALVAPLPYLAVGAIALDGGTGGAILLLALTALIGIAVLFPHRGAQTVEESTPARRFDERDTMFSRRRLTPGSERFKTYYERHPEKRHPDDRFRQLAGLLKPGAAFFDPVHFAAAEASFTAVDQFEPIVNGSPADRPVPIDPAAISRFVLAWAQKLGAVSAGVTELNDYHFYTHVGRGKDYGQAIEPEHRFGIALTVEMDKQAVDQAPYGPTVMESAQQYLTSGAIAVQLATFIRNLGYPARAHIDAHYHVICPLVARDAGLGEIGRMGLLMTPELGPRVRLAVVTTDLPLTPSGRNRDATMIDFCQRCRKCAVACPSRAIPMGEQMEIDGVVRWKINSEDCFTYWSKVGTDCARCVSVCPYSHPANWMHGLVRRGIRNSLLFRRLAVSADNGLYGSIPSSQRPNGWWKHGLVHAGFQSEEKR